MMPLSHGKLPLMQIYIYIIKRASSKYKFRSGIWKETFKFLDVNIILLPSGKIETDVANQQPCRPRFPHPPP